MTIKHLAHTEIDKIAWDKCVNSAYNGNVYASSWYLDIVSPQWSALIMDNYLAVMPLTWKKKFGFNYIFQPFFTQQLGVFSSESLTQDVVNGFILAIPSSFAYSEISMNIDTPFNDLLHFKTKGITTNLKLNKNYTSLKQEYSTNTKRNIKKAQSAGFKVSAIKDFLKIITLFTENKGKELKELKPQHYNTLSKIMESAINNNIGEIIAVFDNNNSICAAGFFIRFKNKVVFLFGASNNIGKENRAMFLLIDNFINSYSEQNLLLDFEGSKIDGVLRFYQGFGSETRYYPQIKINRLPFWARIIKR